MAYETIIYEKKNRVAYITQNRPDALNALSFQMSAELIEAFQEADNDDEVYVSVLTGVGRGFNVGADQKEAARVSRTGERRGGYGGYSAPAKAKKPVVCAINGICAGGGLILLGGCDVVICTDDTTFFDPHVEIGWLPLGETFASATYIPYGIAMRMALMGNSERMNAERAYQIGLVSEVVSKDKLMPRATEIAEIIASKAPLATRWIRRVMRQIMIDDPHAVPMAEAERWVHMPVNRSHDGIEGPRSFAEKRKPEWNGEGGPLERQTRNF
ncbi:MAG: enoyl-CoA hydratase/isomerase family protein [Dehalococcoidales bacterium]|nr:enoyl-CoA hydratase/isomerase family protein [Dehalococcoidales bacterium]